MLVGVDHVIESELPYQVTSSVHEDDGEIVVTAQATPGVPIRITKFVAYQISRSTPAPELIGRCRRTLDRAVDAGFSAEQLFEVIAVVAASTITNYVGSVARPALEAPFDAFAWHADAA